MQWIKVFNFTPSWPTTVIVGLVHGDEIVGKKAIEYLQRKIKTRHLTGKIITLYANLEWHKQDQRFIDHDLNRAFDKADIPWSYESTRASQIKKYFEHIPIDYMFDLHSTPSKSDPMILCTSQKSSLVLAAKIPIKYIIQWIIDIVEGTSLLKYFQNKIKLGMAFECGCHKEKNTIQTGKKIIEVILDFHQWKKIPDQKDQTKIHITDIVHTSDPGFSFTKPYKWFEQLKKWEIRGSDSTWNYSFNKPKILVMPNTVIRQWLKKQSKVWVAYFWDIIENME